MGTYFVLTAFVVVVLGGMGSLYGAFAGSMIIGIVDTLAGYYIAPDLKEVVYFGIFLLDPCPEAERSVRLRYK